MGLFDYVSVNDPRFVCSEGHDLRGEEFQTKDFACSLGTITISTDGVTTRAFGGLGDPIDWRRPLNGSANVYAGCSQCASDKWRAWVEFVVTFEDDKPIRVERCPPDARDGKIAKRTTEEEG